MSTSSDPLPNLQLLSMTNKYDVHWKDYNQIEPNLYLGNMKTASDARLLTELNVKSVLTVASSPIAANCRSDAITYKYIYVHDNEIEDILSYFPECNRFIGEAHEKDEAVFVHCFVGVSRSAAVVMAYVMHKHSLTLSEACDRVRAHRLVSPNPGFMKQLRLFDKMKCTVDANNRDYRQYMANYFVNYLMSCMRFGDLRVAFRKAFGVYSQRLSMADEAVAKREYRCCSCKVKLFSDFNIIWSKSEVSFRSDRQEKWHYIEPMKWLKKSFHHNQSVGHVKCADCGLVLGEFEFNKCGYIKIYDKMIE